MSRSHALDRALSRRHRRQTRAQGPEDAGRSSSRTQVSPAPQSSPTSAEKLSLRLLLAAECGGAGIRGRTGELRSVARPGADVRHLPRFPRCPRVSGPLTEPQAAAVGEPSRRAACQPGRGPPPGRPPACPPGRGQGGPRRPSRLTCLRRGRTPGPTGTRECVTCVNKRPVSFDICFLS